MAPSAPRAVAPCLLWLALALALSLSTRRAAAQLPPLRAPNRAEWESLPPPCAAALLGLPVAHAPTLRSLHAPVGALLREVKRLERRLVAALRDERVAQPTCNQRDALPWVWRTELQRYFEARRWGAVDMDCITDALSSAVHERHARTLFHMVARFSQTLSRDAAAFVRPSLGAMSPDIRRLWRNATRFSMSEEALSNQRCVRDFAFFVKRGDKWYIAASVTNVNPVLTVPDGERSYVGTYLDERLNALPMMLPTVNSASQSHWTPNSFRSAPAFVKLAAGAAGGAELLPTTARENAAVQLALPLGAHAVERANDALTVSNSAILMLPLVFNVIPVALIADVNTFGMLIYTLLTDVLTAVPLLVKGVEVLVIGGQNTYAAVCRVTGANLNDSSEHHNKAAELFVAMCSPERSFRSVGVALIIVALVFMVGGVLAEFAAISWRKRYIKRMQLRHDGDHVQSDTYQWVADVAEGMATKSE